ncbi:energy transducer TonB [Pedobacter sp. SYSU D00535]|uniref:energy transducer TonB n=1 Tax=Pedobacter sp. SYSU D00535 TaxID=2810308 RepID=UPI001F6133E7|nr:energy transducer TonB [Pedobacter sp. SYSU D00535]
MRFPSKNDIVYILAKSASFYGIAPEDSIGRVTLSFIVEKDGRLTDIKVLKGVGFGCDEEAVRVLRRSPAWAPGIQNDRKVRVQYIMPVVFRMD